uniref:Uncharacterized protein n=1 Tax=Romanomermis culicivorax TaxID=13658 RepID=A0A915IMG2_ROMCU
MLMKGQHRFAVSESSRDGSQYFSKQKYKSPYDYHMASHRADDFWGGGSYSTPPNYMYASRPVTSVFRQLIYIEIAGTSTPPASSSLFVAAAGGCFKAVDHVTLRCRPAAASATFSCARKPRASRFTNDSGCFAGAASDIS